MKPRQVLPGFLPVLDGHELLPRPVIEPTTPVALTSEGTEPHLVATVTRAGLHTALFVPLDVFNHTPNLIGLGQKVNTRCSSRRDKTTPNNDKTLCHFNTAP